MIAAESDRYSFQITVPTLPQRDLPQRCLEVCARHALPVGSLSILWDQQRPGRQNVVIATRACSAAVAAAVADELATDGSPRVVPVVARRDRADGGRGW